MIAATPCAAKYTVGAPKGQANVQQPDATDVVTCTGSAGHAGPHTADVHTRTDLGGIQAIAWYDPGKAPSGFPAQPS